MLGIKLSVGSNLNDGEEPEGRHEGVVGNAPDTGDGGPYNQIDDLDFGDKTPDDENKYEPNNVADPDTPVEEEPEVDLQQAPVRLRKN